MKKCDRIIGLKRVANLSGGSEVYPLRCGGEIKRVSKSIEFSEYTVRLKFGSCTKCHGLYGFEKFEEEEGIYTDQSGDGSGEGN